MSAKASLQKSLSIGLTAGVTALWLMAVVASGLVAQHEMNEVFDSALEETAQRILPLAVTDILSREAGTGLQRAPSLKDHDEYLTYLVRDSAGNRLLQSHDVNLNAFGDRPVEGFSSTASHRIYGASAVSETIFIEVAEPLAHRREAAWESAVALLTPIVFLIPVSLLGTWLTVRFTLRRVVVFRESIEARGAGDLSPVTMEQLPEELEPIALSVNRLLERLRRALDAERSFTANSAHELRTPLATALAQVQRLKAELSESGPRKKAGQVEASLQSLARLSEKLLELAKAEGGGVLSEQPQDLIPALHTVVSDYQRREPGRIQLELPEVSVNSLLDPDAFAILLTNLIENALKHGSSDHPVAVSLTSDGTLRVVNAGEIVAPGDLARLQTRFMRSKTEAVGAGLGLAIVEAIAAGANIQLHLRSPATAREDGFEAELNVMVDR